MVECTGGALGSVEVHPHLFPAHIPEFGDRGFKAALSALADTHPTEFLLASSSVALGPLWH